MKKWIGPLLVALAVLVILVGMGIIGGSGK